MSVVRFKKRARRGLSIRYYLCTDEGPVRIPLRLFREMIAGEVAIPKFANSLQRIVEVLVETGPKTDKKIHSRGTSTRFDIEGKVDLHHAVEAVAIFLEGAEPKRISENVLDIGPTLRSRQSEREGGWRPSATLTRLIRADVEGRHKLPILSVALPNN